MRLTSEEVAAIKAAASEVFGAGAVVRLFGSRVHDHLRGGDIDLHIEWDGEDEWEARTRFEQTFATRIEPRRIDLVFTRRGQAPRPIEEIALRDGIAL